MKRVIAFILLMCCIPLSGCWDRKELDEIGIVYAVACDKNPDTGKIILTSQVLRPSAFIQNGRFTESTVENVTTEGDTIIDAFREAASQFDRTLFYSHNKLFIFSEEIAREGIAPYIDALLRGRESRDSVYIFIAKGTPAQNLLGVKHGIDIVSGTSLEKLIKNNKTRRGGTSSVNLIELVKKIFGEGINPVVGTMEIVEQPIMPIEKTNNGYS